MNVETLYQKEVLFDCLNNLSCGIYDIKISRKVDYGFIGQDVDTPLRFVTYISVVGVNFTATISSNDHGSYSIFNKDNVFEPKQHSIEYVGLFKEVYNLIKPLLIIEDING